MKRALVIGLISLVLVACDGRITEDSGLPTPSQDAQLRQAISNAGVIPIGDMPAQNVAMVELGRALFFDKILSGNRDISCASCHQATSSLEDGLALAVGTGAIGNGASRAPGAGREFVPRSAPSLLNAGLGMTYLFWDGRVTRFAQPIPVDGGLVTLPPIASTNALVPQAMLTVLNRREMRGTAGDKDVFGNGNELALLPDDQPTAIWQAIMKRLLSIPEYTQLFAAAFPGKALSSLAFDDAAFAIATFDMQAFTKTNSPFDHYLNRDDAALTAEQKRGAQLFFGRAQCSSCHSGPFLGGQGFDNTGVPQIGPGFGKQLPLDLGRAELPQNDFYKFAFRVAPLRNVELTAPYMHNGAFATLAAVIDHYNDGVRALRNYDPSQLSPALQKLYHGDDATINAVLQTLDQRLRVPLNLTDAEKSDLVAFLKSLTDPAARNLTAIVPARVPSGLPVSN